MLRKLVVILILYSNCFGMEKLGSPEHSAQFLGIHRQHWWNTDFLQLKFNSWKSVKQETLLDVGCGQGDWGRIISRILPAHCKITGMDFEQNWVEKASFIAKSLGQSDRFSYICANAEAIPFPDNSFDIVTCQTVLMHVTNPEKVISEMRRVLKPGGLLFVAEPSTLADKLILGSIEDTVPEDDLIRSIILHRRCVQGAKLVGKCRLNVADELPGLFLKAGLKEIGVCMSDKPVLFVPPYDDPLTQTWIEMLKSWDKNDSWYWNKEEAKGYFVKAGGSEEEFDEAWKSMRAIGRVKLQAIEQKTYVCSGGHIMYLISAKK
jgi:SAM-dependent methyltransferase